MSEFFFEAEQLDAGYQSVPVVRQVSFGLKRGEILTLIGENGAGKSTILKAIRGQLKPLAGMVAMEASDIRSLSGRELARRMSVVLTERIKGEYLTCRDVVSMGRYPYTGMLGTLDEGDRAKVKHALETVGITALADQEFDTLSDGQRQLTMLARALCQEPEILVLDEPTSYLDMRYKLELLDILQRMAREEKLTVIMSLHELELAERVSDKILCIKNHFVDRYGTPEEVFAGNYIEELFDFRSGSYDSTGCRPELGKPPGEPKVFVIGGGGSATPVYRRLQRRGIPFVTGILSENDLDYPVALALASRVISVDAFAEIDRETEGAAMEALQKCEQMICTLERFGAANQANERLFQWGKEHL